MERGQKKAQKIRLKLFKEKLLGLAVDVVIVALIALVVLAVIKTII